MDDILPSYGEAVTRDAWHLIASYVPSPTLCSLARVNHDLHKIFSPSLWGNPAAHFAGHAENDDPELRDRVFGTLAKYLPKLPPLNPTVALTRFKRILKRVRLPVRELTHTLHFPPAQAELYDGPRAEWLRDLLEQLPNLQSLIVSGLPFFDHPALLALSKRSSVLSSVTLSGASNFPLRLLIASNCQNTTSQGLAEALKHLPFLSYLDLSGTLAVRDRSVLSSFYKLPLLQVLKLRNVYLRDSDIATLTAAVDVRVRSLDLQSNRLTDYAITFLLRNCFASLSTMSSENNQRYYRPFGSAGEDLLPVSSHYDPSMLEELRNASYEKKLVKRLTSSCVKRLPYEDMKQLGITHLRISDNNLTVNGIAALARTKRLYVLDAGSLSSTVDGQVPESKLYNMPEIIYRDHRPRLNLAKLTPLLERHCSDMTSLRIDHSVVSEPAVVETVTSDALLEELGEQAQPPELDENNVRSPELDNTQPPLYELHSREVAPKYELQGSTPSPQNQAGGSRAQALISDTTHIKRGSVYAPQVLEGPSPITDRDSPASSTTGLSSSPHDVNGISGTVRSSSSFKSNNPYRQSSSPPDNNSVTRIAQIEEQRREIRTRDRTTTLGLIPGKLPNLRTLTLTSVPCYTRNRQVVKALITFIKSCAVEAHLSSLQSSLQVTPPSRTKSGQIRLAKSNKQASHKHFALERIVLEMAPEDATSAASYLSPHLVKPSKYVNRTKSSTEDADTEAFWEAAKDDFTFFDDDEECGLPAAETSSPNPRAFEGEKVVVVQGDRSAKQPGYLPTKTLPKKSEVLVDVVKELARFRRERKEAFERAERVKLWNGGEGKEREFVEGYWPGEIRIVRPGGEEGRKGMGEYSGGYLGVGRYAG